jgi:AcrR family transcriptional regulator
VARPGRPRQTPEQRLERAHRVLDATTELVLRWGYDKTTIDDIAQRAGVAKGTIYLHWTTRDALFTALLRREQVELLTAMQHWLAAHPDRGTPRHLVSKISLELLRRPLLKAVFLGDSTVMGKLIRQKRPRGFPPGTREAFGRYLDTLVAHGAVRDDLTGAEYATVLTSAVYGFLTMPARLPDALALPDERVAELLADAVDRFLRPACPRPWKPHPAGADETPTDADVAGVDVAGVDVADVDVAAATRTWVDDMAKIAADAFGVALNNRKEEER